MFYYFSLLGLGVILRKKRNCCLCPISRTSPGYRTI